MNKTTGQHKQLNPQHWDWRQCSKATNKKPIPSCNFPHCQCPFDITPDMKCIKGRPTKKQGA